MKEKYMSVALDEAKKAFSMNEVPVGAVIVYNNKIISQTHNLKMNTKNALNHAEMLAISEATLKMGDWRLSDCEMFITLEPCPMCAGAIMQSRIKKIYIGTQSNIESNKRIIQDIFNNPDYYHHVEVEYMNNSECSKIMTQFFLDKR